MRLENYILRRGLNPNTILSAFGEVYDNDNFEDGSSVTTSRIVEYKENEYVKTRSGSVYELGKKYPLPEYNRNYELYFLKNGADAIHKLGNIKRDIFDVELIAVSDEDEVFYIGSFVEGLGFVNVKFRKEDCRKATLEELDMCDNGKMDEIKF